MTILQAFFLGAMVVFTPSLVILAWVAWRAPLIDDAPSERSQ